MKPLAQDEITALCEKARAGDRVARDEVVRRNQGLVYSIARRFQNRGLDIEDLTQEGNVGLALAAERFDGTRGFKFSTFATTYVRGYIIRAVRDTGSLVRVPANKHDTCFHWSKAADALRVKLEREPTEAEVAAESGLDPRNLDRAARAKQGHLSLDALVGHDDGAATLGAAVPGRDAAPDDPVLEAEARDDVRAFARRLLGSLPERERGILTARHGIGGGEPMILDEIGASIGLSRERVRQLEQRGLRRIRAFVDGKIAPVVDEPNDTNGELATLDPKTVARWARETTMEAKAKTNGTSRRECLVPGCQDVKHAAHGLCSRHYPRANQLERQGETTIAELAAASWKPITDEAWSARAPKFVGKVTVTSNGPITRDVKDPTLETGALDKSLRAALNEANNSLETLRANARTDAARIDELARALAAERDRKPPAASAKPGDDPELAAIRACVEAFAGLDDEAARSRVMDYLKGRFF